MNRWAERVSVEGLLWRRFTVRHWLLAPATSATLTLILALGVAIFFSIRLANRSAVASFSQFSDTLTGDADLVITSPAGRLSEAILPELRRRLGPRPATVVPVVEATATLPGTGETEDGFDAQQLDAAGVDLIAIQNLRYARNGAARPANAINSPTDNLDVTVSNAVYVSRSEAERLGVQTGSDLEVILGDRLHRLTVAAVVDGGDEGVAVPDHLLIFDLPALQSLTGRSGWIDRIEIFLPDSPQLEEIQAEVEALLRPGNDDLWSLASASDRKAAARQMTAAFRANLTILSGLALLVGVYLILQALEAAVVRRRPEIATLLSLGVDASAIRVAWMIESATYGVVGSALGLVLGFAGAQLAVQGVARTVNALYLSTSASQAAWHAGEAWFAFLVGVAASLAAGWLPARDAAKTPPAHVLQQGAHSAGIQLLDRPWQGLLLIAAGAVFIQLPPVTWSGNVRFPLAGYGGAVCWLLGASVLAASMFPRLAHWLEPLGSRSAVVRVAVSQFRSPSGRHKLTVAGLVVAVSMASGMSILIHSFEHTMQVWIERNLKADIFVASKGVQNASNRNRISAETWQALINDPDIDAADIGHMHSIELDGASTYLVGARLGRSWEQERLIWLQRRPGKLRLDVVDEDGTWPAYINESFHRRFDRSLGDVIQLPTPSGRQLVRVAGIFADYGNERGSILVTAEPVVAWFGDDSAVNVAAYARPDADIEQVRRRWSAAYPGLAIRLNAMLRAEILRIFRQTFSITHALRFIGIFVAVAGLALALISLLIERRRELATLKELGMSSNQIGAAVCLEGIGVAVLGLLGGLLLSFALGYILIFVVNRQSFGWTLGYTVSWSSIALLSAVVLAAGGISTLAVGRWASRLQGDQEE